MICYMTQEDEYKIAVEVAKKNIEKIYQEMPISLQEREASLYRILMNSGFGPLKLLEALYGEMDKIHSFLIPYSPCKKGCDHCCHIEMALSGLEAEYIIKNVKIKKAKLLRGQACPFLKNGNCSIYAYRPFLCRRHLSLTNSARWCEEDRCHRYDFPRISFSEIERCYAYIVGLENIDTIRDIRDVFARG